MRVKYFHASKFGNGAMVADEFKNQMVARGHRRWCSAHPNG
jgi:hypothetical protein